MFKRGGEGLKLIYKKAISVISGWFESLPILYYFSQNYILNSIVLCVNFIIYYYVLDKLFQYIEKKWEK